MDRELVGASMNEALRNCLARNEDFTSVSGQMNLLNDHSCGHFNQILSTTSPTALFSEDSPPCSSPVPSPASPVHVS